MECVEVGADFNDPEDAKLLSVFNDFNLYTDDACRRVSANPHFNSTEFNLIGIS